MMTKSQINAVETLLYASKEWLYDLETGVEGGYYEESENADVIHELKEAIELLESSNWVTGEMN